MKRALPSKATSAIPSSKATLSQAEILVQKPAATAICRQKQHLLQRVEAASKIKTHAINLESLWNLICRGVSNSGKALARIRSALCAAVFFQPLLAKLHVRRNLRG
jgi:hypothetical protein